jgi:hypothetical protein
MSQLLRLGSAHSFRLLPKSGDRRPGPFVALKASPRLCLADERLKLAEQNRHRYLPPIERLDSLKPIQHLGRFVHSDNASDQRVTCL